jgi:hypothetical protein
MMCPRLEKVAITTDIPADEGHDEQLRRITKFVEARHDSGFPLSNLDVDVSVATPIPKQARAEYTETWGGLAGTSHSLCGFEERGGHFGVNSSLSMIATSIWFPYVPLLLGTL